MDEQPIGDPRLLAVDLGLRTGLACYGHDGRLRWYRSQHFADRTTLRRGVRGVLVAESALAHLVLEGGGPIAEVWAGQATRRSVAVHLLAAEHWRAGLLRPNQYRDRQHAKRSADAMARAVILWSSLRRPTALRHDAAEAILIGLWGVHHVGWLDALPDLTDC